MVAVYLDNNDKNINIMELVDLRTKNGLGLGAKKPG